MISFLSRYAPLFADVIAIEGKCLRRSHDKSSNKSAIYMVSAWSHDNQLTLGQVKVDEKFNEITALPALLENLNIQGTLLVMSGHKKHDISSAVSRTMMPRSLHTMYGLTGA
jgi:hypothetical protein